VNAENSAKSHGVNDKTETEFSPKILTVKNSSKEACLKTYTNEKVFLQI